MRKIWFDAYSGAVFRKNVLGPSNEVRHTHAGWLGADLHPKLKILRAIVEPPTIDVMHAFVGEKRPTELRFHNHPVFQEPLPRLDANASVSIAGDVLAHELSNAASLPRAPATGGCRKVAARPVGALLMRSAVRLVTAYDSLAAPQSSAARNAWIGVPGRVPPVEVAASAKRWIALRFWGAGDSVAAMI